jgi:L,D-transpeptidase catalytic domain
MSRGLTRSIACAVVLLAAAAGTPTAAAGTLTATAATVRTHPAPARAMTTLYLPDAYFVGGQPVTIPGRAVHVGGVVRPFVPGQWITIRAFVGHRLILSRRMRLWRSRNGAYGHFTAAVMSPTAGEVTVYVRHTRTRTLAGFLAQRGFSALDESVGFGSTGPFVELIQQRLAALHFYIPRTGVYDAGTGLALDAYHRLLGWGTYQALDGPTISWLLDGYGAFPVRYPGHGRHAEGNLSRQLLALVDGSNVYWIYPISSGKPSTPTIVGNFRVYSKVAGYLPDGMYFSNFFTGGYAIHGYNPAPDYPASHGCMRLPIVDAIPVYNWLGLGDRVDVYY